jgi:LDH2 family malate/lactate/ureidoglycolate dehydrogenase
VIKVKQEELIACAYEILLAIGESSEGAKIVAESLVCADLRGITTHGSYLLTPIVNRVKAAQLSLPTRTSIILDEAAIAVIEGGNGLGAIAGKLAVDLSIKRASHYGISLVLIRNTNNLGALAYYTEKIARKGMIALMGCNAAPAMAPWGGAEAFLGTNPMAIAIYTGKEMLFSADMASSIVARGKIRKAARDGKSIPNDWALDSEGNLTTDPIAALKGALLPMGGPKGSAIALAIDILSGILAGAAYAPNIKSFHTLDGVTGVGASLIAIDIRKFMELDKFALTMDEYFSQLKNLKKASFAAEIFLPGEIEHKKEIENIENGIPLDDKAIETLNDLLVQFGSKRHLGSVK